MIDNCNNDTDSCIQSLDIHRAELHPILLPLFVHSYLDLVLVEYREAADRFLDR